MNSHAYVDHLKSNLEVVNDYYLKSFQKTQQQIFLESLLPKDIRTGLKIGDFAAGAGSLSYHLNSFFKSAEFHLFELNDAALQLAKDNIKATNFKFYHDDLYVHDAKWDEYFDYVFCWQTLLMLEKPELALENLIKSCKKGGTICLSALFNFDHDVDIYTRFIDHTRDEGKKEKTLISYNTYCKKTVHEWLDGRVKSFDVYPFKPKIDFQYDGKGIGTYTVMSTAGERFQISGGMLMNWGILVIKK